MFFVFLILADWNPSSDVRENIPFRMGVEKIIRLIDWCWNMSIVHRCVDNEGDYRPSVREIGERYSYFQNRRPNQKIYWDKRCSMHCYLRNIIWFTSNSPFWCATTHCRGMESYFGRWISLPSEMSKKNMDLSPPVKELSKDKRCSVFPHLRYPKIYSNPFRIGPFPPISLHRLYRQL